MLQRVLRGRLTFTPQGDGYAFSGPTRWDKLFTGMTAPRPAHLREGDVTGTEHIGPDDTMDGDYGRLLERAHQKGMASQSPPSWNQIAEFLQAMQRLRDSVGSAA